jgi:hypothetical protein
MIYELMAAILLSGVLLVLWSTSDCIKAITRWIEHDLKMRRGNRE